MAAQVIQGFFGAGGPRAVAPAAATAVQQRPAPFSSPKAGARAAGPPPHSAPPQPVRPDLAQMRGDRFAVDPSVLRKTGPGAPLPAPVRAHMEQALGADFRDVRVHVGPQAERIGAIAFTAGADVFFAPGRFNPDTAEGRRLLGHELAHVVQQRQGRVRGTAGAVTVVQDAALEAEADRAGVRAGMGAAVSVQPKAAVRISAPQSLGQGRWRLTASAAGQEIGGVELQASGVGSAEIANLRVDQPHRGRGVGAQLMASARQAGQALGLSNLRVTADDDGSGRLKRWYGRMGFAQSGADQAGRAVLETRIGGPAQGLSRVTQRMQAPVSPRARSDAQAAEAALRALVAPQVANGPDVQLARDIKERLERFVVPRIESDFQGEIYLGAVLLPSDLSGCKNHVIAGCRYVDAPRHAYRSRPKSNAFDILMDVQSRDAAEICHLRNNLIRNTIETLFVVGQINYLNIANIDRASYGLFVELHYVRGRPKNHIIFHKDNRGDNLFVNLNYFHDQEIPGPEYIINPRLNATHETQTARTMNPTFRGHLNAVRATLPAPQEIGASKIPAFGVVGFVDEAIHHTTPHVGHRTVSGQDLATFLANDRGNYSVETRRRLSNLTDTPMTLFTRVELSKAGMTDNQIRRLLKAHAKQNFTTVSLPGVHVKDQPIPEQSVRTEVRSRNNPRALRRQMSQLALNDDLPKTLEGDRSFLRTWVRAVEW